MVKKMESPGVALFWETSILMYFDDFWDDIPVN
jgi:hypothetical protein